MDKKKIAAGFSIERRKYIVIYTFLCASCGRRISVRVFKRHDSDNEFRRAWGKLEKFSRCRICGEWVCDNCFVSNDFCCENCSKSIVEKTDSHEDISD